MSIFKAQSDSVFKENLKYASFIFFFRTVAFHFIYSSIAICYQVCFNCEQLCFDLSGLVVGVELSGLVHFYFRVLIVLTVIHMVSVLMLIPKKACTYCKCVPLCEFVCMHAQNFVYMRAFACSLL